MGSLLSTFVAVFIFVWFIEAPTGLFVKNDLTKCVDQNEQKILLRQIALTGEAKENFDFCISDPMMMPILTLHNGVARADWCQGLHLKADTITRACMSHKGYSFTAGTCEWSQFKQEGCYTPKWLALVQEVSAAISSNRKVR
jgi:hypothetical protein